MYCGYFRPSVKQVLGVLEWSLNFFLKIGVSWGLHTHAHPSLSRYYCDVFVTLGQLIRVKRTWPDQKPATKTKTMKREATKRRTRTILWFSRSFLKLSEVTDWFCDLDLSLLVGIRWFWAGAFSLTAQASNSRLWIKKVKAKNTQEFLSHFSGVFQKFRFYLFKSPIVSQKYFKSSEVKRSTWCTFDSIINWCTFQWILLRSNWCTFKC